MAKYEESQDVKNERSKNRQRATRARRAEEKRVKDLRKEALGQASGTKERRAVKSANEGELLSILGRQSQQGGIYDVSTGKYDTSFNKQGTDETISNDGVDQFGLNDEGVVGTFTLDVVKSDNTAGTATFNGSGVN
mgnify:CR=1 FL=1|tara:strand:- start:388 stop:795 length:408 start_codon:yes stop_codon:yes gene_type:complete